MNKPTNPNITIPESFAANGVKADFDSNKILNGFDRIQPDVLAGDNLNKFIDDTYKGLNYGIKGVDYLEERWKSQITNCLLEVPQRIKLELNNGTLTLKAGSEVIIPNGFEEDGVTPKFDYVTVESDVQNAFSWASNVQHLMFFDGGLGASGLSSCTSGTSFPNTPTNGYRCYRTDQNKVYTWLDSSSSWVDNYSLPLGIFTGSSVGGIGSLDQVFNGMGYVGSTIWVDKGVKGLIPNGRNDDGTLRNIEFTTDKIFVAREYNGSDDVEYFVQTNGDIGIYMPIFWRYDERLNVNYNTFENPAVKITGFPVCFVSKNSGVFNPKQPFRAVDYSDSSTVSGWAMPSNKYIDLTLGASGSTYIAPANGWFSLTKKASAANQYIHFANGKLNVSAFSHNSNNSLMISIPAKKGDKISVSYIAAGSTDNFVFIYAEGEI